MSGTPSSSRKTRRRLSRCSTCRRSPVRKMRISRKIYQTSISQRFRQNGRPFSKLNSQCSSRVSELINRMETTFLLQIMALQIQPRPIWPNPCSDNPVRLIKPCKLPCRQINYLLGQYLQITHRLLWSHRIKQAPKKISRTRSLLKCQIWCRSKDKFRVSRLRERFKASQLNKKCRTSQSARNRQYLVGLMTSRLKIGFGPMTPWS